MNISVHFPAILDHQKLGPYPVRGPVTANLQERNCFETGEFWRGPQPFFGAKPFAPARFAVPGVSSLTAVSRHDSHNSLPSCLPFGGGLTHQHIVGEWICLFFGRGHFSNMVFMLFLFKCSDCTLWRSGTASLTIGTRNMSLSCNGDSQGKKTWCMIRSPSTLISRGLDQLIITSKNISAH